MKRIDPDREPTARRRALRMSLALASSFAAAAAMPAVGLASLRLAQRSLGLFTCADAACIPLGLGYLLRAPVFCVWFTLWMWCDCSKTAGQFLWTERLRQHVLLGPLLALAVWLPLDALLERREVEHARADIVEWCHRGSFAAPDDYTDPTAEGLYVDIPSWERFQDEEGFETDWRRVVLYEGVVADCFEHGDTTTRQRAVVCARHLLGPGDRWRDSLLFARASNDPDARVREACLDGTR